MSTQQKQEQEITAPQAHSEGLAVLDSPAPKKVHRSSTPCPAPAYHTLNRTWATDANSACVNRPTKLSDANAAPARQRWIEERTREQPGGIIRSVAEALLPEGGCRKGGVTGSNSAVAGTDEQERFMVEK